jgi:hypothetical protein
VASQGTGAAPSGLVWPDLPPKSTLGALLKPLFRQFHGEVRRIALIRSLWARTHADPRSGSWPTAAESRTSQVRSQFRCIRILRDFPVETSGFEVSITGNSLTALLNQWCLHRVKKAWPERRASYLCC